MMKMKCLFVFMFSTFVHVLRPRSERGWVVVVVVVVVVEVLHSCRN